MDQQRTVAAIFDGAADTYDRVGVDFFQPIATRLTQELGVQSGERVLDIGCGRGAVLLRLAAAVAPSGQATGLDLSVQMITVAQYEADRLGCNVRLVLGDAQQPDLPPASFNALASSLVLFFLPDPAAALRAWRDLLVDGGRIAVSTFARYGVPWQPVEAIFGPYLSPALRDARTTGANGPFASNDGVEGLLRDAGFTDLRTVSDTVAVRFDDAEHWYRWTMSTGQRAMWEMVPADQRAAVRVQAAALLEDTRQHNADARIGFDQIVRYTVGRR